MSVVAIDVRSTSVAQTRALAADIATLLAPGDLVVLDGGLGVGKTAFAQGAIRALGVDGPVTSPTFAIIAEHIGRVPVAHVDVYRLDRIQELHDVGLEDVLDGTRVVFVEWGERASSALPTDRLTVRIARVAGGGPDDRAVRIEARGESWASRSGRLGEIAERVES